MIDQVSWILASILLTQLSMDDFRHHKQRSKLGGDASQNINEGDASQNFNEDFEILGFGYEDTGERLSDISDGVLSMGTETDGSMSSSSVEYTLFPEVTKPTERTTTETPEAKKLNSSSECSRREDTIPSDCLIAPTSKLPKPTPKLVDTKATRSSLVRSSSKVLPSPRKATAGSSTSSVKSGKRWQ